MPRPILATDQENVHTKALLLDAPRRMAARVSRPVTVRVPRPGGAKLAAIGVVNRRERVVAWDRVASRPVGPWLYSVWRAAVRQGVQR